MNTYLSSRGYAVLKSELDDVALDSLRTELTVSPYNNGMMMTNIPKIPLYLESTKKIYIPKCFGIQKFGAPRFCTFDPSIPIKLQFKGNLRPEQEGPIDSFLGAINDPNKTGGIINLSCGAGKTVIGLYLIAKVGVKSLIIVHKEFLLEQWKERITAFLPEARIGLIKAKVIDVENKDIIIASLQSLSMKDYQSSVFKGIGFVLVDEVHRTATEVFSQALKRYQFQYSLGLSATVTRKDGLSKVFKWFLGDIVFKKKRKSDNVIVHIENFIDINPTYSKEELMYNGKPNISRMLNNIASFIPRCLIIIDFISKIITTDHPLTSKRRKILVLSDRKAHLSLIASHLPSMISYGFYIGKMKPEELAKSETKDVILATFSFASEGFDAKDLDTLVLGTPKSDIEQSVGRILRQKESDRVNIPIIYDIVDMFSMFPRQSQKRQQFYKKLGFKVCHNILDNDVACQDQVSDDTDDPQLQQGICAILDE
jgi:superfamily II DNA or RNA helicase